MEQGTDFAIQFRLKLAVYQLISQNYYNIFDKLPFLHFHLYN